MNDLINAVQSGDVDAVRVLLQQGAEVNVVDDDGASALHYAAERADRMMVALLMEWGANPNARDARFRGTPCGWAIEYLRELGGYLGIELDDLKYAIEHRDALWVERLLARFPKLRDADYSSGVSFRALALRSADPEISRLFD